MCIKKSIFSVVKMLQSSTCWSNLYFFIICCLQCFYATNQNTFTVKKKEQFNKVGNLINLKLQKKEQFNKVGNLFNL